MSDLTERLRMLHQKRRGELDQSDWICAGHGFMGYPPEWPCETVLLLDRIDTLGAEDEYKNEAIASMQHLWRDAEQHAAEARAKVEHLTAEVARLRDLIGRLDPHDEDGCPMVMYGELCDLCAERAALLAEKDTDQ